MNKANEEEKNVSNDTNDATENLKTKKEEKRKKVNSENNTPRIIGPPVVKRKEQFKKRHLMQVREETDTN